MRTYQPVMRVVLTLGLLLLLGSVLATAAPAPSLAQMFTPTPAATIVLDPSSGPSGTRVVVRGYTFTPDDVVLLTWDGNVITPTEPSAVVVNASGQFQAAFYVPTDGLGGHTITAGTAHQTATAMFTIATPAGVPAQSTGTPEPTARYTPTPGPALILTPSEGTPGTRVRIQGFNFTPTKSVTLKWDGVAGRITPEQPITVLGNGTFDGYFSVPADATLGAHPVEADDGTRAASAPFTVIQATPTYTPTPSNTPTITPTFTPRPTQPTNTPTQTATVTPTPSPSPTWIPMSPGSTWIPPTAVWPTATYRPVYPTTTRVPGSPTATLGPGTPSPTGQPRPTKVPDSGVGFGGPGGMIFVGGAGLVLAVLLLVLRGLRTQGNL
ncbi:MAG: hypothetical protein KKA73_04315 [Chloroflexi bacterium]|nr:hypothetical protein [Chloroflexota bacterium]